MWNDILLFVAAFVGGAMNAVAGGGSFFSFPALFLVLGNANVPNAAIVANATNTVALWPGSVASVAAYRKELSSQRAAIKLLSPISVAGGLAGAWLLLHTPSQVFTLLLPYLMLGATLLFAFSPRINQLIRQRSAGPHEPDHAGSDTRWRSVLLQAVIAVYGGYFGGGIGILMLAALALMGLENIHEMNALKTLLATLINGTAVVTFALARAVAWPEALLMAVGAIVGGYGGAALARRVPPPYVRSFVMYVGLAMSGWLFAKSWGLLR